MKKLIWISKWYDYKSIRLFGFKLWILGRAIIVFYCANSASLFKMHENRDALYIWKFTFDWTESLSRSIF